MSQENENTAPAAEVQTEWCSICQGAIDVHPLSGWKLGHNPWPVNDGRCCSACNDAVVIPARINRVYRTRANRDPEVSDVSSKEFVARDYVAQLIHNTDKDE